MGSAACSYEISVPGTDLNPGALEAHRTAGGPLSRMALALDGQPEALARLRCQWGAWLLLSALATGGAAWGLAAQGHPQFAGRWLLIAALVLASELGMLWRRLAANHLPGQRRLLPWLGWANTASLVRGLLLAWLAGFLFAPWPGGWLAWAPGALYTLAVLLDGLDGAVARASGQPTELGAALDINLDALGILVAPLLAVWYGQLPAWFLLVSAARYLFLLGLWLRVRQGRPVYDLPPSAARRALAGIVMGFTAAVLWPLFGPPLTALVGTVVMAPFLVGFARDWLAVSGRRARGGPRRVGLNRQPGGGTAPSSPGEAT